VLAVLLGDMAAPLPILATLWNVREPETTHRYQARRNERDAGLRARLKELAAKRMRFGYRRLTALLVREGIAFAVGTG